MEKNTRPLAASPENASPELDNLGIYFQAIGKIPLLDAQQEVDLSKQIEAGLYARHLVDSAERANEEPPYERELLEAVINEGQLAKETFIRSNLKLVVSIAKKYGASHRTEELTDIIQNGQLGLIWAVEKFDYTKGFKFSTFATWWIRQTIQRSGQETSIRMPEHIKYDKTKVQFHQRDFYETHGYMPDVDTLAELTGLKPAKINQILELPSLTSLNEPVSEYDKELGEFIPDPSDPVGDMINDLGFKQNVLPILGCLEERDKRIILMRYGFITGENMSTIEIARELGLSRARVDGLRKAALETLRQVLKSQNISSYDTLAL